MKVSRYILLTGALLGGTILCVRAQDLNPTVEVTNEYQGRLQEVHKPTLEMAVPDSLLRFDLDFDYSVFERQYAGAGDFKPYLMDLKPSPSAYKGRKAYVKAGAGAALRTTTDFVISPSTGTPLQLNIFGSHNMFLGKYRDVQSETLDSYEMLRAVKGSNYSGVDMVNRLGVSGAYDWNSTAMTFDAGYWGLYSRSFYINSMLNAAVVNAHVGSNKGHSNHFKHSTDIHANLGSDSSAGVNLTYVNTSLHGTYGSVYDAYNSILVDVDAQVDYYNEYNNSLDAFAMNLSVTPKYAFQRGNFALSAGVRLAHVFSNKATYDGFELNANGDAQFIFPDVRVSYMAVPGALELYAKACGGSYLNSYSDIKENWHFFNLEMGRGQNPVLSNSLCRADISVGAEGNVASFLHFKAQGGVAFIVNGLLDAVAPTMTPGVAYRNYSMVYGKAQLSWNAKPVLFDASLLLNRTNLYRNQMEVFEPALASGEIRVRYNWNDRLIAGVVADGAVTRRGYIGTTDVRIPGFVDLGLQAEFAMTRNFALWAQAGNLLSIMGQTVQRHPLQEEPGLSILGGVVLMF